MLIFNDNMLTLYTEGRIYVVQLYIKAISLDLANVNVKVKNIWLEEVKVEGKRGKT